MIIALRRISKEDSRNNMTTVIGNLNEKRRDGIERTAKTRKVVKKDDRKIEISRRENALTWRKTHLSVNKLRRDDWRAMMSFLRKRTASLRKTLIILATMRRRN